MPLARSAAMPAASIFSTRESTASVSCPILVPGVGLRAGVREKRGAGEGWRWVLPSTSRSNLTGGNMPGTEHEASSTSRNRLQLSGPPRHAIAPKSQITNRFVSRFVVPT